VSQSGAPWGVVSDKVVCGVWCLERHPMGCGVWTTKKKAFIFCLQVIIICLSRREPKTTLDF
jgi:hypothetical protein